MLLQVRSTGSVVQTLAVFGLRGSAASASGSGPPATPKPGAEGRPTTV